MDEQTVNRLGSALVACAAIAVMGWMMVRRGEVTNVVEAATGIGTGARTITDMVWGPR